MADKNKNAAVPEGKTEAAVGAGSSEGGGAGNAADLVANAGAGIPNPAATGKGKADKPTLGRLVFYTPRRNNKDKKEYPATVTHVFGETVVNLNVYDDGSFPLAHQEYKPTSVSLSSDGSAQVGCWRWPPRL